jgi:hypothetical protein
MARKIIQIAHSEAGDGREPSISLIALCDDGTVWARTSWHDDNPRMAGWRRIPDVPQDDTQ